MNALALLATAYFNFMTLLGVSPETPNFAAKLPEIFSAHVKKIENGAIIADGLKALEKQLTKAHQYAFPWKTELLDTYVDEVRKTAVIRFSWQSQKVGKHITMAIIKFDKDNKIIEINEVYNKQAEPTNQSWDGFAPKLVEK